MRQVRLFLFSPRSTSAGLDAAVSTSPVSTEAAPTATQLTITFLNQVTPPLKSNLVPSSLLYPSPTTVEPATSLSRASFSPDQTVVALRENQANIVPSALRLPPALTPPKGAAIQILRERLARLKKNLFRIAEAYIKREAQLKSLQEQVTALVSFREALPSERDVARPEWVSRDEEISYYVKR